MLIQPLESLTVKTPEGVRTLERGRTYNLPEPQAQKLLAKAPGKVRAVTPFVVGDWVEFLSPLIGMCTGRVLNLELEALRITEHSVVKEAVTIPVAWVTRTLEGV